MRRALPAIVGAALLAMAGGVSAAIPTCASGQNPFELYVAHTGASVTAGTTPGDACAKWFSTSTTSGSQYPSAVSENVCVYTNTGVSPITYSWRPIRQVCTLHPDIDPLSAEKVNDYMTLFAAFLLAGVVVLGAKAIYSRFRIDHDPA